MTRIEKAFSDNRKVFIPFITAGDPSMEKTEEFVLAMEKAGARLVEIGIPFSDPIAEGAVIEQANLRALSAGATTDKVFDMVKSLREKSEIALVFLTYLNPVFTYGYDRFFAKCKECGVDGVIIPDMPYEETDELQPYLTKYDVQLISLIAPTSENRVAMIAGRAEGFIYCVTSMGVTGVRSKFRTDLAARVQIIREHSDVPVAVGFGISTPEQAREMASLADGVIVGSALVKVIEKYGQNATEPLKEFVESLCSAM